MYYKKTEYLKRSGYNVNEENSLGGKVVTVSFRTAPNPADFADPKKAGSLGHVSKTYTMDAAERKTVDTWLDECIANDPQLVSIETP